MYLGCGLPKLKTNLMNHSSASDSLVYPFTGIEPDKYQRYCYILTFNPQHDLRTTRFQFIAASPPSMVMVMRTDEALNFNSIYDHFCFLFTGLVQIYPFLVFNVPIISRWKCTVSKADFTVWKTESHSFYWCKNHLFPIKSAHTTKSHLYSVFFP